MTIRTLAARASCVPAMLLSINAALAQPSVSPPAPVPAQPPAARPLPHAPNTPAASQFREPHGQTFDFRSFEVIKNPKDQTVFHQPEPRSFWLLLDDGTSLNLDWAIVQSLDMQHGKLTCQFNDGAVTGTPTPDMGLLLETSFGSLTVKFEDGVSMTRPSSIADAVNAERDRSLPRPQTPQRTTAVVTLQDGKTVPMGDAFLATAPGNANQFFSLSQNPSFSMVIDGTDIRAHIQIDTLSSLDVNPASDFVKGPIKITARVKDGTTLNGAVTDILVYTETAWKSEMPTVLAGLDTHGTRTVPLKLIKSVSFTPVDRDAQLKKYNEVGERLRKEYEAKQAAAANQNVPAAPPAK